MVIGTKYFIVFSLELPYNLYIGKNFFISPNISQIFQNYFKGVILIDIEIRKCSRIKPLLHKAYDKLEDLLFSLISRLPEFMIPKSVMNWLGNYTNKRIAELQRQIIQDRWHSVELDEALKQIKSQNGKK